VNAMRDHIVEIADGIHVRVPSQERLHRILERAAAEAEDKPLPPNQCPACLAKKCPVSAEGSGLYDCVECGAIFGECYLARSYEIVKPRMTTDAVPPDRECYFDFTCLGSDQKITHRHGWYDPRTGLITQIG